MIGIIGVGLAPTNAAERDDGFPRHGRGAAHHSVMGMPQWASFMLESFEGA